MNEKIIESYLCSSCCHKASGYKGSPSVWSDCEECSINPRFNIKYIPNKKLFNKKSIKKLKLLYDDGYEGSK